MKRIKMLVALGCAVMFAGVIAAPASAQSGTATSEIALDAPAPPNAPPTNGCSITFDWDNNTSANPVGPSQAIDISNMETDSQDPDCAVEIVDGGGTITTDAGPTSGVAELEGEVEVENPIFSNCFYTASLTGTWDGDSIDIFAEEVPLDTGGFLCPDPVDDVRIWGTID